MIPSSSLPHLTVQRDINQESDAQYEAPLETAASLKEDRTQALIRSTEEDTEQDRPRTAPSNKTTIRIGERTNQNEVDDSDNRGPCPCVHGHDDESVQQLLSPVGRLVRVTASL